MEETNGKATIREVRDLIDKLDDEKISPMRIDIAAMKTLLTEMSRNYRDFCDKNDKDHEKYSNLLTNIKIKIWATAGFIGTFMGFVGVIIGKYIG